MFNRTKKAHNLSYVTANVVEKLIEKLEYMFIIISQTEFGIW